MLQLMRLAVALLALLGSAGSATALRFTSRPKCSASFLKDWYRPRPNPVAFVEEVLKLSTTDLEAYGRRFTDSAVRSVPGQVPSQAGPFRGRAAIKASEEALLNPDLFKSVTSKVLDAHYAKDDGQLIYAEVEDTLTLSDTPVPIPSIVNQESATILSAQVFKLNYDCLIEEYTIYGSFLDITNIFRKLRGAEPIGDPAMTMPQQ